jgi:hypothetical protein
MHKHLLSAILFRAPIKPLILLTLILFGAFDAFSQSYKVSGTIMDNSDNQPVIGAFVYLSDLKDSTDRVATTSDVNGKFLISGLKKKGYKLTIQSINYKLETREISLSKSSTDLGTIQLTMESRVLREVVVIGQGTAVQKGDTTVMTADAFKVTQDANAEDLVKKMPGITVENGTVKARGEDVKQVLVDGKPFFGDDPSVALRNLPAEVIDRVQVYNKLSDQAELTGFDDGESSRTINIITKRGAKYSSFGKFTGGTDFDSKYLAGGSLNLFSGPRRFTFTGMTNNINMANFAMQDLIGSTSGGSQQQRGGWGGRNFGGSGGISKNSSLGFNYIDNWGKKIAVSGSYFYNSSATTLITNKNTENLLIDDGRFETDSSYSYAKNQNHRVNMRIEYTIDSMNSMIIVPRFSLQDNSNNTFSSGLISGGSINSGMIERNLSENLGFNLGSDITWRHKFVKKGRTLSIRESISYDKRNNETRDLAKIDSVFDNQFIDGFSGSFSLNTNLNYTEPIGKKSQLQINYNNRFRRSDDSREAYEMSDEPEFPGTYNYQVLGRLDSLSNVYDNDYITNRFGVSYLYNNDKLSLSAGVNYERADLTGSQTFPIEDKVKKTFQNILPTMMINYKFSDIANLRIFYRTDTDAPSITELQNAINNSDRRRISTGNPQLEQEYEHNLIARFSYANPTSGFNAFMFMRGAYATNIIARKVIYAEGDTLVRPDNIDVILYPASQLSYPVNLDHQYSFNSMVNLSYFVKPLKSNISLVTGFNYMQSPEFAQSVVNWQNYYSLLNSLIITSNISTKVDFTLSYTSSYGINKYSLADMEDKKQWYQSVSAKLNLIMWKGITFSTDIIGQYNQGTDLSDEYSEKYFVWNASLGKKFLKSQAAEIKLGAFDIFDQNNSISRSVSPTAIVDSRTNAYRRYFLVLFTYNLRAARGKDAPVEKQDEQRRFPGGPPPGMPPGGFRPGGGPPPGGYHDH